MGSRIPCLIVLGWLVTSFLPASAAATQGPEEKFDSLQVGTHTYRNVTVTTKSKDWVFIIHSEGMRNVKVADLPAEVRERLGYLNPNPPQVQTNSAAAWARQTVGKLEMPQVKEMERLAGSWRTRDLSSIGISATTIRNALVLSGVVLLILHLLFSYCCSLICQKAGVEPGLLVWLPVLQVFPLFKAAGMSPLWFLALLVPGLNLVPSVLWCIKIAQARDKSIWLAILLIVPFTSLFAFLYLAFSDGRPRAKDGRRTEIMTLETA